MSRRSNRALTLVAIVVVAIVAAGVDAAPDDPQPAPASKPQGAAQKEAGAPEQSKPGPEHAVLAREAGTWEAAVEIRMGPPGAPPQISKGVEIGRLCCNGLWLIKEFKSDPAYPSFEGHGVAGYDPVRKRYTGIWVDSDLNTPMIAEGTYDAASKTMTWQGSVLSGGKQMRFREVDVWKDENSRQFTMYMPGPDGKEAAGLNITYSRRK